MWTSGLWSLTWSYSLCHVNWVQWWHAGTWLWWNNHREFQSVALTLYYHLAQWHILPIPISQSPFRYSLCLSMPRQSTRASARLQVQDSVRTPGDKVSAPSARTRVNNSSHAKPHSNEPQLSSLDFTSLIYRGDGSSIETEECLQERAVPGGARALEFEERMPHAIKNGLECIGDQRCANSNFPHTGILNFHLFICNRHSQ